MARARNGLDIDAIAPRFPEGKIGCRIEYRRTVGSTNDLAKHLAADGAIHGTVVVAEEQIAGRGRSGRRWFSPAGCGIWCSALLRRDEIDPGRILWLTHMGAVAGARALESACGVAAGVKWPNDVVLGEKKLGGVLTESSFAGSRFQYAVVGMGINLLAPPGGFPEALPRAAAAADTASRPFRREDVLVALLAGLNERYEEFISTGPAALREELCGLSTTLGKTVLVSTSDGRRIEGYALEIDRTGALLVETAGGERLSLGAGDSIK